MIIQEFAQHVLLDVLYVLQIRLVLSV